MFAVIYRLYARAWPSGGGN